MAALDQKPVVSDLEDTEAQVNQPQSQRLTGWRLFAVQGVLCLGLLLSVMESSIVATALVTIGEEFQDFSKAIWSVLAYLLTYMGFAIVFARFSDVTGRRWAVLIAWAIFTVFSLACGLASTVDQLIIFRALQGVGGSGLYTLTMVIVPEVSPPELFVVMSGAVSAVFAVSAVLGPILGGVITRQSTWRWIFWLNSPFGLTSIIIILVAWPSTSRKLVQKIKLRHVDWLGAFLGLAASVLLVSGLENGGSAIFSWNSGASIAVFTISALCWVALIIWIVLLHRWHQAGKTKIEGIFPPPVVVRGRMPVVIITTFFTGFAFLLVLIYLPERYQIVQLQDPIQAGVNILPMLCATALGAFIGGGANMQRNNTFWTLLFGNALVLLGCGLLSTAEVSLTIPAREYGYQILLGTGTGMVFSTATIMCTLMARFRDLAVAQGVLNQVRVLGGSIALAIATIIFNNIAVQQLTGVITADELKQIQANPKAAYTFTLDKQVAVREVFVKSFTSQLRVCTYVMVPSVLIALLAYQRHPPNVKTRKAEHDNYLDGRPYNED